MSADLVLGFAAGLAVAAVTVPVGVSGAVFLLPFQISVLGVPSPAVTPTNLLFNVISIPGALARYRTQGSLASPLTGWLLAGTLPGVVAGAVIRVRIVPDSGTFQVLVACLLLPLGLSLLWRAVRGPRDPHGTVRAVRPTPLVLLGLLAGAVGGIYGIGGGSLIAPILVAVGHAVRLVAPAALVATFVTSCVGAATVVLLATLGSPSAAPDWSVGVACGLGGLLGGQIGARAQGRVPQRALTALLGGLAVALAIAYLTRAR